MDDNNKYHSFRRNCIESRVSFPTEFPYEFDLSDSNSALNSPIESMVSSTETEEGNNSSDEVYGDPGSYRLAVANQKLLRNSQPIYYSAAAARALFNSSSSIANDLSSGFTGSEAVDEFGGMITNLKMELDDNIGASEENVKPLSDEYVNALKTIYNRYITYLDAFGPEETYLWKKVETELGTKLIYLKMRCSGISSEWEM
ncbi:hypothetical protein FF1_033652 [Malus domestica]